ncbi:YfbK domain-containing protein [Pirellulaceae bacterium SH501]
MSPQNSNTNETNSPIEPWKLTAYLLGELSEGETALIERRVGESEELKSELRSLQKTLGILQSTLSESSSASQSALTDEQRSSLEKAMAYAVQEPSSTEWNQLAKLPFYRRRRFVAALAIAACIPIAWLAWNSYQLNDDQLAKVDGPAAISMDVLEEPSKQTDESGARPSLVETNTSGWKLAEDQPVELKQNAAPESDGATLGATVANDTSATTSPTAPARKSLELYRGNNPGGATQGQAAQVVLSDSQRSYGSENAGNASSAPSPGTPVGGGMGMGGMGGNGMGYGSYGGYGSEGAGTPSNAYGLGVPGTGSAPGAERGAGYGGLAGGPGESRGGYLLDTDGSQSQTTNRFIEPYYGDPAPQLPPELRSNLKRFPPAPPTVESSGDRFDRIVEKPFIEAEKEPVTTFSIDVDTASYSKIRQSIQQRSQLPTPDMVRIEEMINYFQYEYPAPVEDAPFAASLQLMECPWNRSHKLVRVGIQAKKLQSENRPRCNLVFLLDVSGSMNEPNKLPLVQRSLAMLAQKLREDDRVAIVVYAGAAGCVLESTPGSNKEKILASIYNLQAGGSTNGGEGIRLAYSLAEKNFIEGGSNRVILCTDGDFNVGVTDTQSLVELMKEQAKKNIFLTCLGYGAGNYNDSMMEKISKDGNGVYGMVDSDREAKKLMVDQLTGTLVTVAKDVKIQMDFNPNLVRSYRLIGYEDRQLANADFNNDRKDAGDIGAGHSVTAFYEIVPTSLTEPNLSPADSESKYKRSTVAKDPSDQGVDQELLREWLTLKIRSKKPEASESTKQEFVLANGKEVAANEMDKDLLWSTSVAEFGLLLRRSKMAPQASWDAMIKRASEATNGDEHRTECLELMRSARSLAERP